MGINLPKKLRLRIASAVILAPIVLAAIIFGGLPFIIFLHIAGVLALYEWYQLSSRIPWAKLSLLLGVAYILIGFLSFYILGLRDFVFSNHAFLLILLIWASDTGAYVAGKVIGGPKLFESVSPNKTWAGLAGAILFPAILALVFIFGFGVEMTLFVGAALIGAVAQAGDLIISKAKRLADVKDTGSLIPGHGGILDRIDSLLLAAPVFLTVLWVLGHG